MALSRVSVLRAFASTCVAIAVVSGLAFAQISPAPEQTVKFNSAATPLDQSSAPPNAGSDKIHESKPNASIQGFLSKPTRAGPFPAVVLLHSCLGIPKDHRAIGDLFAAWGYVSLFVDDFTTRGLRETCSVDFAEGVVDAYGASSYLSKLPYVDPQRIAAVGYSQGADTVLRLASTRLASVIPPGLHFKAAVAYYPPCANQVNVRLEIPVLILIGKMDEVTPAADCQLLANNQSGNGPAVKLVVYPDAHHRFDDPELAGGKRLFGMWMQYDGVAAAQSKRETRDFLTSELAR
jgi:dienelactone hydrolase